MDALPQRIVDGGSGEWARDFVRQARVDACPDRFRRGIARELGLAAGAVGVVTTTSSLAKAMASVVWVKWLGIGFAIGVGSTLVVSYSFDHVGAGPEHESQLVAAPRARSSSLPSGTTSVNIGQPPASPAVVASNQATAEPRSAVHGGEQAGPPAFVMEAPAPAPSSTLAAEMAAIELVRRSLAASDAQGALQSLDRYRRSFPGGLFSVEASVLRVEALSALGRKAEARELGQRFLVEHADSPYAQRIRSLLGTAVDSARARDLNPQP